MYYFNVVIRIGFTSPVYEYFEPGSETLIRNVTVIREDNHASEYTVSFGVIISDPASNTPAAQMETKDNLVNYDFRLGSTVGAIFYIAHFPFYLQNVSIGFFLNSDTLSEDTEAFQMSLVPVEEFPCHYFQGPSPGSTSIFQSTEIRILDDDYSKC